MEDWMIGPMVIKEAAKEMRRACWLIMKDLLISCSRIWFTWFVKYYVEYILWFHLKWNIYAEVEYY